MIGRLTGTVQDEPDGTVVIDVNGVGYEVIVPIGTLGRATTKDDSGKVTLFVHTHVREDVLSLFGFASDADRLAFRTLIGVSSVGPKTAIAVLSAMPAPDLGRAIAQKELGKLTQIPGIGKKTAERLLLELKDKLPILEAAGASRRVGGTAPVVSASSQGDVLARALVNMGYKQAEADRAAQLLASRVESTPLPELLRDALALLSK